MRLTILSASKYKSNHKFKQTMTKKDIISNVKAVVPSLTNKQCETVANVVLQSIANGLERGEEVQLLGFGTFKVSDVPERQGHNPRTGETITIAAHKVVKFKAAKAVSDKINK